MPPRPASLAKRSPRLAPILLGAAAVGATALFVRSRAREAERRHPPAGRFVHVDGVRLRYREWGQGPAVVVLHGNSGTLEDPGSSGLVERLARTHRVIVPDRPGFGYSGRPRGTLWTPTAQARLIRKALGALGVEEAVVYGHSLGAQVAVALALEAPDLVRGLVLASGYYFPTVR